MVLVREETASDVPSIRHLNKEAFGQPLEANIVDNLRVSCDRILFRVALQDDLAVRNIFFSPVVHDVHKSYFLGL